MNPTDSLLPAAPEAPAWAENSPWGPDGSIVGFDARETWIPEACFSFASGCRLRPFAGLETCETWQPDAASHSSTTFRLRQVVKALPVDFLVWPSLFCCPVSWPSGVDSMLPVAEAEWPGENLPLWASLADMRSHLATHWHHPELAYWEIAITRLSCPPEALPFPPEFWPRLSKTVPGVIAPAWRFLGYDVADSGFISALSNCGMEPAEAADLGARYGAWINHYHLFAQAEPALRFLHEANGRVAEHAPFLVFGLWWIATVGAREKASGCSPCSE